MILEEIAYELRQLAYKSEDIDSSVTTILEHALEEIELLMESDDVGLDN